MSHDMSAEELEKHGLEAKPLPRQRQKITLVLEDSDDDSEPGYRKVNLAMTWDPPIPQGGHPPATPAVMQLQRMLQACQSSLKSPQEQQAEKAEQQRRIDLVTKQGNKLVLPTANGRSSKKRRK